MLVLLPMHGQPLQACYCGLYTIEQKVNEVDYLMKTPGQWKEETMCCVNMFKPYHGKEGNKTPVMVAMNCVAKNDEHDVTTQEFEEIERSQRVKKLSTYLYRKGDAKGVVTWVCCFVSWCTMEDHYRSPWH